MSKPYELPSGKWLVKWTDERGKRLSKVFSTEAQAKAALRRAQVGVDDIRAGVVQPRAQLTVADAYQSWIATRPARRRKDDESRFRMHILPHLGATPLLQVPDAIPGFLTYLAEKKTARHDVPEDQGKPLAPNTVKNVLRCFAKFMSDMKFTIKIGYKVPENDYAWIQDPSHVARYVAACKPDWFQVAAAISIYAGLRKGEVAGLTRNKVDWTRKLITVAKSYDDSTKGKRLRHAPLSPDLEEILRPWLLTHPGELVVMKETPSGDELLVEPISPKTKMDGFARRAAKRAGVTSVNFQQLRHTCASHLALRVSLPIVGEVLGHVDPKTTKRYSHLDSESLSQDKRLHLSFRDTTAKVIPIKSRSPRSTPK